jgi:MoxR-like ATPase
MAAAARAAALAKGKPNVGFDEVREVAGAVLNHRLVLGYEAGLERITSASLCETLLSRVAEVERA